MRFGMPPSVTSDPVIAPMVHQYMDCTRSVNILRTVYYGLVHQSTPDDVQDDLALRVKDAEELLGTKDPDRTFPLAISVMAIHAQEQRARWRDLLRETFAQMTLAEYHAALTKVMEYGREHWPHPPTDTQRGVIACVLRESQHVVDLYGNAVHSMQATAPPSNN